MSILFYKKPAFVVPQNGPLSVRQSVEDTSSATCSEATIPPELSFENIVCNKCAPPCSLQDFLDYLIYVSHDAQNLQFYLWMVDYHHRFRSAPPDEKTLSPRWNGPMPVEPPRKDEWVPMINNPVLDMYSEDISSAASSWEGELSDNYTKTSDALKFSLSLVKDTKQNAGEKDQTPAGVRVQPFRAEIDKILNHYILPGSLRELNLTHDDRATVIRALRYTTHPSALLLVKKMLDAHLRAQAHPNFVRWSICNGNRPWTLALKIFAIINITIGFLIAIMLTLSNFSRYWRIFAAFEWWFGITNIIAASQGLCVLLHRMHTRQYHSWETNNYPLEDDEAILKGADMGYVPYESTKAKWPVKMEVFGPANNYGEEPWVNTYPKKPWYRRLFERRALVKETGLKSIQNRVIRQAELWALLITIPLTVAFVALPKGSLF